MGVDQLISGGDVDNPVFDSLEANQLSQSETITQIQIDTSQSIPSGTPTQIEYGVVNDDDLSAADTTNNQLVVPDSGKYMIIASVYWESDANWATGDRAEVESIRVNGNRRSGPFGTAKVGTDKQTTPDRIVTKSLNQGDEITAYVYQKSGASQTISDGFNSNESKLTVIRLG